MQFIPDSDSPIANVLLPRWPKMTDIDTGINSPGGVNAYLMWQQVSLTP